MMKKFIYKFIGLILLFSSSLSYAQDQLLIEKLQQGGLNIFFSHSITPGKDPAKFNPPNERPFDCSSGSRQLNDEGREQSRRIGQRIKELNIPIGEVYSSSFCRCEETAKLAFDRLTTTDWLVVRPGVFKPDLDRALRSIPTKGFFKKVPSGKNNVFVGHGVTFTQGVLSSDWGLTQARIFLEEGEAAVFEPGDKPRMLGKIKFH